MMKSLKTLAIAATAAAITTFGAQTASAAVFTYDLADNADGGLTSSGYSYGLRLDGLIDVDNTAPRFILSFSNDDAQLKYDDNNGVVQISGSMVRSNSNGTFGAAWDVFYQMTDVTNVEGASSGLFKDFAGNGFGYISNGSTVYELGAKSRSDGMFFGLTTTSNRQPDDNNPTTVGEGWVDWTMPLDGANDFLFVADLVDTDVNGNLPPVPLPAAGWMLIAAVGGLGAMKRRSRKAA